MKLMDEVMKLMDEVMKLMNEVMKLMGASWDFVARPRGSNEGVSSVEE